MQEAFPEVFGKNVSYNGIPILLLARKEMLNQIDKIAFNTKSSSFIRDYEVAITQVLGIFGVDHLNALKYAAEKLSLMHPNKVFTFLLEGGVLINPLEIKGGRMKRHTMVHGGHDTQSIMLLADLVFPQFREGSGEVWSLGIQDLDFVLRLLKSDAEKYGYTSRLHLIDMRPIHLSDGAADRSGIKSKLIFTSKSPDYYEFISSTGERELTVE